jgi:hypothetical protein
LRQVKTSKRLPINARLVANLLQASRTREPGNIPDSPSLFTIGGNAIVARRHLYWRPS